MSMDGCRWVALRVGVPRNRSAADYLGSLKRCELCHFRKHLSPRSVNFVHSTDFSKRRRRRTCFLKTCSTSRVCCLFGGWWLGNNLRADGRAGGRWWRRWPCCHGSSAARAPGPAPLRQSDAVSSRNRRTNPVSRGPTTLYPLYLRISHLSIRDTPVENRRERMCLLSRGLLIYRK